MTAFLVAVCIVAALVLSWLKWQVGALREELTESNRGRETLRKDLEEQREQYQRDATATMDAGLQAMQERDAARRVAEAADAQLDAYRTQLGLMLAAKVAAEEERNSWRLKIVLSNEMIEAANNVRDAIQCQATLIAHECQGLREELSAMTANRDLYKRNSEAYAAHLERIITESDRWQKLHEGVRVEFESVLNERDDLREKCSDLKSSLANVQALYEQNYEQLADQRLLAKTLAEQLASSSEAATALQRVANEARRQIDFDVWRKSFENAAAKADAMANRGAFQYEWSSLAKSLKDYSGNGVWGE